MSDYELYHASTRKHKYIKKIGNRYFYTQQEIAAYLKSKKGDVGIEKGQWIDGTGPDMVNYRTLNLKKENGVKSGIGIAYGNKTVSVYNQLTTEKNAKKYDNKYVTKRRGRLESNYDPEFGSYHTLDLADKKTYKKRAKERADRVKEMENLGYSDRYIDVREERKKKISKAKKQAKKNASKSIKSMKKQAARGKKVIDKIYTKATTPNITVTYDEAKLK